MTIRRVVTVPIRKMLRAAGYDIVRLPAQSAAASAGPAVVAAPADGPLASNAVLRRIYHEGTVEDAEGHTVTDARMSAVQLQDGLLLYRLVRHLCPKQTLEIGMAYAASSLFILEAHRENGAEGRHTAMDPFQRSSYNDVGLLNIRRSGFDDRFTFYPDESYKVLPQLLADGRQYDLIFIDGDHLFDSVLLDFYYADKMLKPGGFALFHDMDMPSVRKAVSFILHNKPYEVSLKAHEAPPVFQQRVKRFIRNTLKNPLEPHIWPYYSLTLPYLTCLLRKTGEDRRLWTHYAGF